MTLDSVNVYNRISLKLNIYNKLIVKFDFFNKSFYNLQYKIF